MVLGGTSTYVIFKITSPGKTAPVESPLDSGNLKSSSGLTPPEMPLSPTVRNMPAPEPVNNVDTSQTLEPSEARVAELPLFGEPMLGNRAALADVVEPSALEVDTELEHDAELAIQPSAQDLNLQGLKAAKADAAIAQLKTIQLTGGPDAMKAPRSFRKDKDFDRVRKHPDVVRRLLGETQIEAPPRETSVDGGEKQPRPVDLGAKYRARGVSDFHAGKLDSAKHFLQMALASNPEDVEAKQFLTKVRRALGERNAP